MRAHVKKFFTEQKMSFSWQRVLLICASSVVVVGLVFGGLVVYANTYRDRVLPGVFVGELAFGGLSHADVRTFLQTMNDKLIQEGFHIDLDGQNGAVEQVIISPVIVTDGGSLALLDIDVDADAAALVNYGKSVDSLERITAVVRARLKTAHRTLTHIRPQTEKLRSLLDDQIHHRDLPAKNASVTITTLQPLQYQVVSSSLGMIYGGEGAVEKIVEAWSRLEAPHLTLQAQTIRPEITEQEIQPLLSRLPHIFVDGALTLTYQDQHTTESQSWVLSKEQLRQWLAIERRDNDLVFGLSKPLVVEYLTNTIKPLVTSEGQEARFHIDATGKVKEFQNSRPGVSLEMDKTFAAIDTAFIERTLHNEDVAREVSLVVARTEPHITTGSVNDLGIADILGVGVSDFSFSPANRLKNIRHGVEKLNGLLIRPDEIFSTVSSTGPFTLEDGYVPELVIEGDQIRPAIGGGLCQIGTTLFRMAMNSGLPIVERRNHSLVVSHYNDPVNHLPGTDATIYDPSPDFRFKNDTGNYILIQAKMDMKTNRLSLTLWGTSDGRKGSYTHPVVSRWIPYGETRYIPSSSMAPGAKKCQAAYKGADSSFTYTRVLADGTVEDRVFKSHYRALPQICLVGAGVATSTPGIVPVKVPSSTTNAAPPKVEPELLFTGIVTTGTVR